jgi:hypothetical protein
LYFSTVFLTMIDSIIFEPLDRSDQNAISISDLENFIVHDVSQTPMPETDSQTQATVEQVLNFQENVPSPSQDKPVLKSVARSRLFETKRNTSLTPPKRLHPLPSVHTKR